MPSLIPLGRFKVEYMNGEIEEVRSNFGAVMELEKELPEADTPGGTSLLYGIWLYKGRPLDDPIEFGRTVYNITPIETNGETDPSKPEAGEG